MSIPQYHARVVPEQLVQDEYGTTSFPVTSYFHSLDKARAWAKEVLTGRPFGGIGPHEMRVVVKPGARVVIERVEEVKVLVEEVTGD